MFRCAVKDDSLGLWYAHARVGVSGGDVLSLKEVYRRNRGLRLKDGRELKADGLSHFHHRAYGCLTCGFLIASPRDRV